MGIVAQQKWDGKIKTTGYKGMGLLQTKSFDDKLLDPPAPAVENKNYLTQEQVEDMQETRGKMRWKWKSDEHTEKYYEDKASSIIGGSFNDSKRSGADSSKEVREEGSMGIVAQQKWDGKIKTTGYK